MKIFRSRGLAAVALAALCNACVSATMIRSQPPGARLFLDGSPVGNTPYPMADTKIWGSSTSVRLESPGYEPLSTVIVRNEEFDPGACAGGFFFLFPWLWLMGYRGDHYYELTPSMNQGYQQPGYPPAYPPQQYPPQQGYPPGQQPPQQGYPPPQQGYPPQQQYPQGQPPPPPPPPPSSY